MPARFKVDAYCRFVLTVIAVCLVWLCVRNLVHEPAAAAQLPATQTGGKRVIEATEFILRDDQGKVRGIFGMNDGLPFLKLQGDEAGAKLFVSKNGTAELQLMSAKIGPSTVRLVCGPEAFFYIKDGKTQNYLSLSTGQTCYVGSGNMSAPPGQWLWKLP